MSTPPGPPGPIPIPPNIAQFTFPLLFGEIVNAYLFGILTVQVYLYYITFPKDPLRLKLLVYSFFVVQFASIILCLVDVFHWFASGFGQVERLDDVEFSSIDTPLMDTVLAAAAQAFYCYRMFRINRKTWPVCVLVLLCVLVELVTAFWGGIMTYIVKTFASADAHGGVPLLYTLYGASAAADLGIAATMVVLLTQTTTRVNQRSSTVLTRILLLIIETNLLSTTLAMVILALFAAFPTRTYYTVPGFVIGKIYSNSTLLILNNRHYMALGIEGTAMSGRSGTKGPSTINTDRTFDLQTNTTGTESYSMKPPGPSGVSVRTEVVKAPVYWDDA